MGYRDDDKRSMHVIATRMLVIFLVCLISDCVFMGTISEMKRAERRQQAYAYGEVITNAIQLSLENSLSATQTMKYFYEQYGEKFFGEFPEIARNIMEDESLIASIYVAPEGVIQAAYPNRIAQSTIGFQMLEDPEQGPRAKLAVDTRKITVAGPHELVEGGVGFIIRNPIFEDDVFKGFTIIVLDWDKFTQRMLNSVNSLPGDYYFGVWKDNVDEHAVTDEEGYIFRNTTESIDRTVVISFSVPNDTWHLAVVPVKGWNVWRDMISEIIIVTALSLAILIISWAVFYARARNRSLNMERSANKAKSAFLFNMSHEIRTPMNAIMGYTDLIEKHAEEPDRIRDYVDKIHMASDFLLSLINNTLEMARIESGKSVLSEEACNLEDFVDAIAAVFAGQIEKKNLTFTKTVNLQHPLIMADETKLREIYLNILSNAVKYTPAGGSISLNVTETGMTEDGLIRIRAEFDDNGIGMSKEFIPSIFDEFTREKTSTESKIAGTGLGMPIVKQLVDMMKGTVLVESEPGKGTTFTVIVNHRAAAPEALANQVEQGKHFQLRGRRILLAEDNDLNAEITTAILEEEGMLVERAVDGIECLNLLQRTAKGYYDLILMDIQMPHMDGYQATVQIRSGKDDKADIPIVAMTANAFEEDKQEALAVGMNAHISKPIVSAKLFETLDELLKQSK